MQRHLWGIKAKRFCMSVLLVPTLMAAGLVISAIGESGITGTFRWWYLAFTIGLIFIIMQTYLEYQRREHDPTWALKYQDVFNSRDFRKKRSRAAKAIIQQLENPKDEFSDEVDPILDFFEDLGFYCKGGQISPEVIHHHFYEWIRPYLQATDSYIHEEQKEEPTAWEHLAYLQDVVDELESSKLHKRQEQLRLSRSDLMDFMESESQEDHWPGQ